ncbi:hypothetical protein [Allorhodopirellula heiligendammensis]|uniref:Uncharacterized protein n=1 Tax=Allorhodopirellula heiligendammensis TaxID=2714739 RepID=A0A5C6BDZ8_9BACT|nr:hypothetical protein [Allorhodopirellula heiligendammensis]TWU09962.1 hypothetical protein Poly21_52910 [Allorhodopirellula heiligendammensis]
MLRISNLILSSAIKFLLTSTVAAQVTTVPIEVQSVDASERKISVRYNGKISTLALSGDAAIIVEGKASVLTTVIPGDIGTVEFDKKIAAVTRLDVKRSEMAPAESLNAGWEEVDQRLIFLMVRLVDVEANLDAIDKEIGTSKSRAGVAKGQAGRAQSGNDRMDQRGGGPVRWDKFYGTTAEKFFYHPTENHTYHTQTVLSHQSPAQSNQGEGGVPSYQGLPVHQRPPQFDYMYRANQNAQRRAQAEAASFKGNAVALAGRRHELELEQSKLWCEIAFRAVARNDLDRKALYRFAPSGSGKEDLLAATNFVVTALSVVENGQKDQSKTFRQIKTLISDARYELGDRWLKLGIKSRDESTDEWRFVALARKLEDVSANLGDSYTVSVERENAGDWERRDLYRGLLQKALLQYAETVLALDEMASAMAESRGFEPNMELPLVIVRAEPRGAASAMPASMDDTAIKAIHMTNENSFDGWVDAIENIDVNADSMFGNWVKQGKSLTVAAPNWTKTEHKRRTRILLPVIVDGDYNLEVEFTRHVGADSVNIIFPVGHKHCMLLFSAYSGKYSGVNRLDGHDVNESPLTHEPGTLVNGRRYRTTVSVRLKEDNAEIEIFVQGQLFLRWSGRQSAIDLEQPWSFPDKRHPALGANGATVTFHQVRFQALTDDASWVRSKASK